jgi:hypothetical protein
VLVIVGATHKGYLDAYLDMMQDVRIVDAMQFLRWRGANRELED